MHLPRRSAWRVPTALGIALALVVAACAGGSPTPAPERPVVSDAWVRPPMGPDRPAAAYLTITGSVADDALIGASSPTAASVELHETMMGSDGSMGMHAVERIEIAAGATVRLEPGGYHLMLMRVTNLPAIGELVEITLTFGGAGDVVIQAEVRAG